jgi:hypothetical protein
MPKIKQLHLAAAIILGAILALQRSALAQQFVDAPEPKPLSSPVYALVIQPKVKPAHEFFDRRNVVAFSAAAAMRAADSAYTCAVGVGTIRHNADGSVTIRREDSLPVNSCHGVALMNAAFTGTGLGGSYLLHKLGRHKLERVPNWIVASVPALGIAYTATHQNARANSIPAK